MMPDYGCPVQAWTIYGIATPLIRYIYGIQPEAYKKTLTLSPNLPSDWDFIEMKDLPVGNNKINNKDLILYRLYRILKGSTTKRYCPLFIAIFNNIRFIT